MDGIFIRDRFLRKADILNKVKPEFVFGMRCVIWSEIAMFSCTICEAGYQAISREIHEKISGNTEK